MTSQNPSGSPAAPAQAPSTSAQSNNAPSHSNSTPQVNSSGHLLNEKPGTAISSQSQAGSWLPKNLQDKLAEYRKAKRNRADRAKKYLEAITAEQTTEYPIGYPSIAAYMSADIDGRVYRRFAYIRNGILLRYQAKIVKYEEELIAIDNADEKASATDAHAKARLMKWRYHDFPPASDSNRTTKRKEIFDKLEDALGKYDDLLLREHEIMSIQRCPGKMHKNLFDIIYNGKPVKQSAGPTSPPISVDKHMAKEEYPYLNRRDDFLLLGNQEDAWLSTYSKWMKPLLPSFLQSILFASSKERAKSQTNTKTPFYSNERIDKFVKAVVCMATTSLLVVPIVVLYAMSVHQASAWLKIGVLLIFTVIFSFILAALTNASRSEMFGASAGYCAVLIVFLTYSGP